jgi:tetraacyldisaccharide 4'-kinase
MKLIRKILWPFALVYGFITCVRNFLYDKQYLKSVKHNFPVIVVGNLSVGGTGKTPQIEYLIRLLQNNFKVAVLSRGYKRKSKGFVLANNGLTANELGDEPYQYYKKFKKIIVAVDANRLNGIKMLQEKFNPNVVLLDDAFQHRRVKSGLNVLLTTYGDLYVDDQLLPVGNLRETVQGAQRAQIIVVTKCPVNLSEKDQENIRLKLNILEGQSLFFTTINYGLQAIGEKNEIAISELRSYGVILVTGIANPSPLLHFLTEQNISYRHIKFKDHHNFTNRDIDLIKESFNGLNENKKIVLTTEKDYVRIFAKLQNIYYLPIETTFLKGENTFNKIINAYVGESSGNS